MDSSADLGMVLGFRLSYLSHTGIRRVQNLGPISDPGLTKGPHGLFEKRPGMARFGCCFLLRGLSPCILFFSEAKVSATSHNMESSRGMRMNCHEMNTNRKHKQPLLTHYPILRTNNRPQIRACTCSAQRCVAGNGLCCPSGAEHRNIKNISCSSTFW